MITKLKTLCISVVILIFLRIYECSLKFKKESIDPFDESAHNIKYYVEKAIMFSEFMIILMLALIVYDLEQRNKEVKCRF